MRGRLFRTQKDWPTRATYQTRQRDLATKNEVVLAQVRQREQELVEMRSRRERLSEMLALIQRELNITGPLVKKGVMSEVELLRLEREVSRIRTDLEAAILAMPRIESAINEAKRRLDDNTSAFRSQVGELSRPGRSWRRPSRPERSRGSDGSQVTASGCGEQFQIKRPVVWFSPSPMAEIVPLEDQLLVETRLKPSDIILYRSGNAMVKVAAYDFRSLAV
jgi:adhesin transport system membrane fusion protein